MFKQGLRWVKRYQEIWLYLIFGAATTIISVGSFYLLNTLMGMAYLYADILAWVLSVLFAFVTNKTLVFKHPFNANRPGDWLKELASFSGFRLLSLGIELGMLMVGISLWHLNATAVKLGAQVLIVVLNYLFSKLFIFKPKEEK